jgi:hypothetical protein
MDITSDKESMDSLFKAWVCLEDLNEPTTLRSDDDWSTREFHPNMYIQMFSILKVSPRS